MTRKFTFLLMALLALAGFKSWGQETITVDFESGIPSGWTTIDADGDGNNWTLTTGYSSSGSYSVVSESYRQVLYPDNFLVSPQLTIGTGANISFWAYSYSSYPEKIGVAVSTTGNSASDFTVIKSWTYGSGEFNTNGKILTADLSEYAGQQVYLAIRHYESVNQWKIYVDDITINLGVAGTSYNISYDNANIQHGSISGPATAYAGQTITVTATPDAGYALEHITVNGTNYLGNTFTMPEDNATVTATFVSGLTVNDGTDVYDKAPFYGEYANSGLTKSQFVIPASYLESIQGSEITQLKFYLDPTSSYNPSYTSHTWDVYINEMNDPSGTWWDFCDFETMTNVYSGSVSIVDNQLTITLDEPFQYNSNSLMIGFNQTNTGFSGVTKWIGSNNTTGSAGTYRCRAGWPGNKESMPFLPKTTFYTQVVTCPKPTGLTASNITATGATISWNDNGAESYNLDVNGTVYENVTNPYILDVELSTTYTVKVQAVCDEDETSAWSSAINFTTPDCWDGHTINYTLNDSYGDGWNGAYLTIVDSDDNTIETLTLSGRTESGSLTLCSDTYDFVWHKGSYDSECSFSISENDETLFTCNNAYYYTDGQVVYTLDLLEKFSITLTQPEDAAVGTISADYEQAAAGTTVNLSANFNLGYTLNYFMVDGVQIVGNTFEMPEHNVTVSVAYNTLTMYDITSAVVTGGTVHAEYAGNTITEAPAGTEITLVAEAATDYIFEYFTVDGVQIPGSTYTIGTSDIEIGASFRTVQTYAIHYYVNGKLQKTLHPKENAFISIVEPSSTVIPAGTEFVGWSFDDIETYTTTEPSIIGNQVHPTQECNVYAVFSYTESVPATSKDGETWKKLDAASDLKDGDEIVFVYEFDDTHNYVMTKRHGQYNGYFDSQLVDISNNEIVSLPSNATTFTAKEYSGNWKFQYEDEYTFGETTLGDYYWENQHNLAPMNLWEGIDTWDVVFYYYGFVAQNTEYTYNYVGGELVNNSFTYKATDLNPATIYKKGASVITTSYYMTSVLTEGTVANATVKNIIVVNPITVSGRLEMNAAGLFRNENVANFVFADGAQFYYTGEETVNATFEKDITGYTGDNDNYYLIANPTDNDVVANLTDNDYDLYSFDPWGDEDGYEWINEEGEEVYVKPYSNEDGSAVAVGYLYANSEDVTLEFAGVLNPAGSTDIELTYAEEGEGIDFPGFNLIGNPYACKAYVSGYSFYKMVNGELRANNARTATIAPCEGVFVEATAANQQVTVTTTAPNVGEDDINVNITKNSRGEVIDRAVISFDGRNDMHKFMMNPANTNIRLAKNGQEYAAISCDAEGEIPVSFKAAEDDTYTITVNANNENTRYLHLIDNLTGMDVDLLANPSYTFNALTSDYAYRFKLVFSMNIDNNQSDNTNNFAFMSDGNLVINNIDGEATLQIVDVLGRVVSTEIVSGSYNKALNLKAGLYILNLNGMTQKIVVE